jgi:hypothetical protein
MILSLQVNQKLKSLNFVVYISVCSCVIYGGPWTGAHMTLDLSCPWIPAPHSHLRTFFAVIVITNSYLNYSWKNWIGIIFHLFTTVCKYGVSTLQCTLKNMEEIPSKFQMDFYSRKKYFSHKVFSAVDFSSLFQIKCYDNYNDHNRNKYIYKNLFVFKIFLSGCGVRRSMDSLNPVPYVLLSMDLRRLHNYTQK